MFNLDADGNDNGLSSDAPPETVDLFVVQANVLGEWKTYHQSSYVETHKTSVFASIDDARDARNECRGRIVKITGVVVE